MDSQIRTHSNPDCPICGARGKPLYQRLYDRLFGVPGEWDLKKCPDRKCGLVWLDPMPIEDDIGKAYQTYYTHTDSDNEQHSKGTKDFPRTLLSKIWAVFLHATLIYRCRKRSDLMFLDKDKPGKILEVGCGNGYRLNKFRAAGWQVEGQEVDSRAVKTAQKTYGLKVHLGPINELKIPEETFDAIIMNHVIEHVHNPVKIIAHCRRLLKSGGKLILVTPNIESFGHRYFGSDWLNLDPPRHLHIFSCKTLQKIASQAGFSEYSTFTSMANAEIIAAGSFDLKKYGRHVLGSKATPYRLIASSFFQLCAAIAYVFARESGEECILVAKK